MTNCMYLKMHKLYIRNRCVRILTTLLPVTEANRKRPKVFRHNRLRKLLNVTWWKDKVRNKSIRDTTRQDMLETRVRKRRLGAYTGLIMF